MLSKTVVFCALMAVAFAAQAIGPVEPKPAKYANLPGCYISELDRVIMVGQTAASKKSCMQYRCGGDIVTYESCGSVAAPPGCKLVLDDTKPYPDCCPSVVCP